MKFSALNMDFSGLGPIFYVQRGRRTRVSKPGTPLKNGDFFAIRLSSVKTLADKHRRATYHNKHW